MGIDAGEVDNTHGNTHALPQCHMSDPFEVVAAHDIIVNLSLLFGTYLLPHHCATVYKLAV